MKRIAYITWDFSIIGGINQVITSQAKSLEKYYEVFVISLVKSNNDNPYDRDAFYVCEGDHRGREVMKIGRKKLIDFINDNKIDIVFLMGFQVSLPAILMIYKKTKAKLIFCDHEALMSRINEKKITIVRFLSAVLSNKTVLLTKSNMEAYKKVFHIRKRKLTYIYNYVDPKVLELKQPYDINSKQILSIGRFSPEKNYEGLTQIAKKVLPNHKDWQWHIYGDGETRPEIEKLIKENGLENQLILKGQTNKIAEVYKDYAIFVLTSFREGFPLVLIEAKANNIPCISFDILTGPNEIINDQKDGFLIPPMDYDQMAEQLEKLISDNDLRLEFSNNSKQTINDYSEETAVKQWRKLIEGEC